MFTIYMVNILQVMVKRQAMKKLMNTDWNIVILL